MNTTDNKNQRSSRLQTPEVWEARPCYRSRLFSCPRPVRLLYLRATLALEPLFRGLGREDERFIARTDFFGGGILSSSCEVFTGKMIPSGSSVLGLMSGG